MLTEEEAVYEQLDRDQRLLEELDLQLRYSFETHVHADHVTSSGVLRKRLGCKTVVSALAGAGCPDILVEPTTVSESGSASSKSRRFTRPAIPTAM